MTQEPNPCPFCGAHDSSEVFAERRSDDRTWEVTCDADECIAAGPVRATKREAIAAWNTRAAMPAREVTGWQPIETAPDDGICKDIWVKGLGRIPNVHMHSAYHDATHWMPRPAAPEAK